MKNIIKRIDGLIHIAEKRQTCGSELDKGIGRQIERNLRMAKRIIYEEITTCQNCKYGVEFSQAIDENMVSFLKANEMYCAGADCLCSLLVIGTQNDGYCSRGEKGGKKRENERNF